MPNTGVLELQVQLLAARGPRAGDRLGASLAIPLFPCPHRAPRLRRAVKTRWNDEVLQDFQAQHGVPQPRAPAHPVLRKTRGSRLSTARGGGCRRNRQRQRFPSGDCATRSSVHSRPPGFGMTCLDLTLFAELQNIRIGAAAVLMALAWRVMPPPFRVAAERTGWRPERLPCRAKAQGNCFQIRASLRVFPDAPALKLEPTGLPPRHRAGRGTQPLPRLAQPPRRIGTSSQFAEICASTAWASSRGRALEGLIDELEVPRFRRRRAKPSIQGFAGPGSRLFIRYGARSFCRFVRSLWPSSSAQPACVCDKPAPAAVQDQADEDDPPTRQGTSTNTRPPRDRPEAIVTAPA